MWIKDNITRTGKQVWYEAELIEKISGIIKNVCRKCPIQCCDTRECEAQKIKDLIQKYTGE